MIDDFFLTLTVGEPFRGKDFKLKKYGVTGLISEKKEASYAKLNQGSEAATSNYSVTGDFLKNICSVLVAKNHQKIKSRCLIHVFPSQIFFNDINHC